MMMMMVEGGDAQWTIDVAPYFLTTDNDSDPITRYTTRDAVGAFGA